jgi:D-aminopeptidase
VNVLVATDMEGIGGIDDYRDCLPSHPAAYARGCGLMTEEALVAVEAVRAAGGAGRISVGDWHMVGTNVERDRLPGVEVRPIAELALVEEEPSMSKAHGGPLDAVVFIGHHASTRNSRAFCSHTFVWEMEVTLDGEPMNEVQVYAQGLAAEGIPVLVASGDRWMLEELGVGELGGAHLIPTKEGQGRARARSYDLRATRAALSEAIGAAIAAPPSPPPSRSYPAELRIAVEGRELVLRTVADAAELLGEIATVFRTSPSVAREYRQLARLLPAGAGPLAQRAHRRLGSAIATPVMLAKERSWLRAAPA